MFFAEVPAVFKHLPKIFVESELPKDATVSRTEIVQQEGKSQVEYYSPDSIISVGYRVNSRKATQCKIWVTKILKEYMIKGFASDNERLKQGKLHLERIILKIFWNEFVLFVQINVGFGSRLQLFLQNAAEIVYHGIDHENAFSVNELLAFRRYGTLLDKCKGRITHKSFVLI